MYKIGVDIGTSITKMICAEKESLNIIYKFSTKEKDIKKSLDRFILENNINTDKIESITLTGVGASNFNENIYDIPVKIKDEFICVAEGASFVSKEDNILVVSIGTGTAFIRKNKESIEHMGGTGVGGGTLENLCKRLTNVNSFEDILKLAEKGNLNNIDLKVKDITENQISNLNLDTTVCNFGKNGKANDEDLILAVINMIFETIGVMSAFLLKNDNIHEVITTGTLTTIPLTKEILKHVEELHDIKFIIPENSEYITCIGAII